MGKVGKTLFGSPSKETSESHSDSHNLAYPAISGALSPALGYVTQGGNAMSNLLGLGGGAAQTAGLENFANSGGMQFLREQGNRQISSSQGAKGLFNSGSTGKAMEKYGQGLGSTYLNQYMQNLLGLSNIGLGSANAMSSAGTVATSDSEGKGTGAKKGIAGDLVKAGAAIASDIRLKKNIEKIGEYADGLGKYRYDYVEGHGLPSERQEGVMAHEVKELRPWAYVPNFLGEFAGVNYSTLGN